jgi:TonB family protein
MRRMILTSLVLLPVMAHAASTTSTEPQPSPSSALLAAEIARPASAAPAGSIASANMSSRSVLREVVQTQMTENFADAALLKGGTLTYAMMGSVPTESSAPKVTRAVEVNLSPEQLAEQPAVSHVVLHAIVDEHGIPRNVGVSQSGGSVIDRAAIEAVNQYRFVPATYDNKPTWSTVSITIKIQKP